MNLLLDRLDESNKEFSNFRTWIQFELIIQNDKLSEEEKIKLIAMLLGTLDFDYILYFYRCGKDVVGGEDSTERAYCFEQDDFHIFAAFWEQYKIDLNAIEYMHWWKFKALLLGLNTDVEFSKIMGYRTIKITSDMSKHDKEFYSKMKSIYKLKKAIVVDKRADELFSALSEGRSINGLL